MFSTRRNTMPTYTLSREVGKNEREDNAPDFTSWRGADRHDYKTKKRDDDAEVIFVAYILFVAYFMLLK